MNKLSNLYYSIPILFGMICGTHEVVSQTNVDSFKILSEKNSDNNFEDFDKRYEQIVSLLFNYNDKAFNIISSSKLDQVYSELFDLANEYILKKIGEEKIKGKISKDSLEIISKKTNKQLKKIKNYYKCSNINNIGYKSKLVKDVAIYIGNFIGIDLDLYKYNNNVYDNFLNNFEKKDYYFDNYIFDNHKNYNNHKGPYTGNLLTEQIERNSYFEKLINIEYMKLKDASEKDKDDIYKYLNWYFDYESDIKIIKNENIGKGPILIYFKEDHRKYLGHFFNKFENPIQGEIKGFLKKYKDYFNFFASEGQKIGKIDKEVDLNTGTIQLNKKLGNTYGIEDIDFEKLDTELNKINLNILDAMKKEDFEQFKYFKKLKKNKEFLNYILNHRNAVWALNLQKLTIEIEDSDGKNFVAISAGGNHTDLANTSLKVGFKEVRVIETPGYVKHISSQK